MATIKNVYIATYTLFQWPNNSLIARKYDKGKFILKTHFVTQVKWEKFHHPEHKKKVLCHTVCIFYTFLYSKKNLKVKK